MGDILQEQYVKTSLKHHLQKRTSFEKKMDLRLKFQNVLLTTFITLVIGILWEKKSMKLQQSGDICQLISVN